MNTRYSRARLYGAVAIAFFCGMIFASGFDLTRFGWAQTRVSNASAPIPAAASAVETETAFEAVADRVKPTVVSIETQHIPKARPNSQRRNGPPSLQDFFHQFDMPQSDVPEEASGSGFIISSDGYILTNNHVVAGADKVTVTLLDRRTFSARVIGRDSTTDVAVIKVDATNLPTVNLGDDTKARVGQWVLAIGNPLGLNFTVTAGIVSAKGREARELFANNPYAITDYIQTDAAINPGNSGGPLVNIRGEVIGINSAIASGTGYYNGYGFAIPITLAKHVMNDIMKFGHVERAVLGVSIASVTPADAKAAGLSEIRGAKVGDFQPEDNSPAKKAGMEIGDIIVSAAGQQIDDVPDLQSVIRGYHPGETVDIEVARFGQRKTLKVTLAAAPSDQSAVATTDDRGTSEPTANEGSSSKLDALGVAIQNVPSDFAQQAAVPSGYRHGVLVTDVSLSGPSYRNLVPNQDVIVQELYPTRRDLTSASDLQNAIGALKNNDVVELKVWNAANKQTRAVSLTVSK